MVAMHHKGCTYLRRIIVKEKTLTMTNGPIYTRNTLSITHLLDPQSKSLFVAVGAATAVPKCRLLDFVSILSTVYMACTYTFSYLLLS